MTDLQDLIGAKVISVDEERHVIRLKTIMGNFVDVQGWSRGLKIYEIDPDTLE